MERKPKKNWILYICFLAAWFTGWEIAVNRFQYTFSQVMEVVYNTLVLLGTFGVQNKKWNIANKLKRWGKGAKRTLEFEKVTLPEHIVYALIEFGSRSLYPIFRKRVIGKLFLFLFLGAPFLVTCHPVAVTINVVKEGVEVGAEAVGEALHLSEFSNKEGEEESQEIETNEIVYNIDSESKEKKDNKANQDIFEDSSKNDMADLNQNENERDYAKEEGGDGFYGDFLLKNEPLEKTELLKVYDLILYYGGIYPIKEDASVEELREAIEKKFADTSSLELLYMSEFFRISDGKITVPELNDREDKFLTAISEGKKGGAKAVPDSGMLDEVIQGRKGIVCKKKSYRLAFQLANDYLRYTLEYYNQGKVDENTIYYSGMAILAGELQLCYAKTEDERQMAIEWIDKRYQEINYLGLIEKYCKELDISDDAKSAKINADEKRLNDILTCLEQIKKGGERFER